MPDQTAGSKAALDHAERLCRRLETVRETMASLERPPGVLLVVSAENRRYLTGFTGSSGAAIITASRAIFVTDFRYIDQAGLECPGWEIVRQGPLMVDTLAEVIAGLGEDRVGFEREYATFGLYEDLASRLKGFRLTPVGQVVESARELKEEEEIDLIRRAAALGDKVLTEVLPLLRPGAAERDIALEIEYLMRKLGAEDAAFDTIVASGARSSLPHGKASAKLLEPGDFVTIDMGARFGGYCSDLTRTFVLSPVTDRQKEIYALVLEAQEKALAACRPGRIGREVDEVARDIISARGHGEHFGHGLGHGVGLAVHEGPRLAPTGDRILRAGNVVTVEPGVYITGWGGVRIEDLVVVRPDGVEVLSSFPKELMVL
jgi:Xaa-Pro aminopeptidase